MNTNHQPVLNSITLIVDTFVSQSKNYDSVSVVESMLKWNISHLSLIKADFPVLALDVDLAINDIRRIASKTIDRLTQQIATAVEREAFLNSGDSARLPAGAPVLDQFTMREFEQGQGGNQCRNFNPNDGRFCDCDDCTSYPGTCTACGESSDFLDIDRNCPDCAAVRSIQVFSYDNALDHFDSNFCSCDTCLQDQSGHN